MNTPTPTITDLKAELERAKADLAAEQAEWTTVRRRLDPAAHRRRNELAVTIPALEQQVERLTAQIDERTRRDAALAVLEGQAGRLRLVVEEAVGSLTVELPSDDDLIGVLALTNQFNLLAQIIKQHGGAPPPPINAKFKLRKAFQRLLSRLVFAARNPSSRPDPTAWTSELQILTTAASSAEQGEAQP